MTDTQDPGRRVEMVNSLRAAEQRMAREYDEQTHRALLYLAEGFVDLPDVLEALGIGRTQWYARRKAYLARGL